MKLKSRMYKFLDRSFCRILLGFLASIYLMYKKGRYCWIFHDGVWIHRYLNGVITANKINLNISVSDIIERTKYNCLYNYKPNKEDIIIDVGAGTGEETLAFSKGVGQSGKVISIEANPKTFLCLTKMCEYNKLHNVIVLNCAIIGNETDVFINDIEGYKSCSLDKKGSIKVRGRTLDNIINELGIKKIDFIKMNIEGAEKMAIFGMINVIKRTRFVCIACHDFRAINEGLESMRTKEIITDFLKKHGFLITTRESDKKESIRDYVYGINKSITQ